MSVGLLSANADPLTGSLLSLGNQRQSLANSAIGAGTVYLQRKKYDLALRAFQQATAYQPDSADAHVLMARTYTFLGKSDEAVEAYRSALRADPGFTDARMEMASLLLESERTGEAEAEYRRVVNGSPGNAEAARALGFIALEDGRVEEAQGRFEQALRVRPTDAVAHFGLGRVRLAENDASGAETEFLRAVDLNRGYAEARYELGFLYVGQGRTELANEQVSALESLRTPEGYGLAEQLDLAMFTPRISYLDVTRSTFRLSNPPGTPVASLSPSLATPGGSAVLAVSFVFNQPMSVSSVQNAFHWSITRASGGVAGVYNNGFSPDPSKEASILPYPISVQYDAENRRATVYFRIRQNATGDAVIDPSHWVFRFHGTDQGGKLIDPLGDQYDGWAGRKF